MPANLTQQYLKAEAEYRRATSPDEELQCLQVMLRELPKHKGTDKLQADLKTKISRAKKEGEQQSKGGKKGSARIPRQGAGRVVIIGPANCGKSQLLAAMTRATPAIAPYPFTTNQPQPGMMPYEDIMVQLIDTAPVTADVFDPTNQALIRGADVVLLVVDLGNDDGVLELQETVERIAETKSRLGRETCLDEDDIGVTYSCTFLVGNKTDLPGVEERLELLQEFCPLEFDYYPVSATEGTGLDELKTAIFGALDVVRVYTKMPNQKDPDFNKPFTIRRGGTLLDVAHLVHKDFAKNFKHARVWGSEVHPGTQVKGDYVVNDKDIVELHM